LRLILLLGVAFNIFGAMPLFTGSARILAATPGSADRSLSLMLFSGGTALVFASLYLYLFFNPVYVVPFLVFGASLKTWASVLSFFLYLKKRTSLQAFIQFGVGNGVVAFLFWLHQNLCLTSSPFLTP